MVNASRGLSFRWMTAAGAALVLTWQGSAASAGIARFPSVPTGFPAGAAHADAASEPAGAAVDGLDNVAATPGGRLPGVWTNYTNGNIQRGIAIDPITGDIWIATEGGAIRVDIHSRAPTKYTSPDGLGGNKLHGVAVDEEGTKWFAAYGGGLGRLSSDGNWRRYHIADGLTSTALSVAVDAKGGVWVGTWNGGANHVSPEGLFTQVLFGHTIYTIATNPLTGDVWFTSEFNGAYVRSASGEFMHYTIANGLADNDVGPIAIDRRGNVWFGHRYGHGVSRLSPDGRWEYFTRASHGLASDGVWSIAVDNEGNAWLGHDGAGASRLPAGGGPAESFTFEFDLGHVGAYWVFGIAVDATGNVWFSTLGGLVYRTSDGKWARLEMDSVIQDNIVSTVASDTEGGVWVGMEQRSGAEHLSLDGRRMRFDETNSPLGIGAITRVIRRDTRNRVWFATDRGVHRLNEDGRTWQSFSAASTGGKLPRDAAQSLVLDGAGGAWVGTDGGASYIGPDDEVSILTHAGTRNDPGGGLVDDHINDAAVDGEGGVWFGTNSGLSHRSASGSWRTYTRIDGLESNIIEVIAIDREGNVWMSPVGSPVGVPVNVLWRETGRVGRVVGLPPTHHVRAIAIDNDGNKWFGMLWEGLVRLSADNKQLTLIRESDGLADPLVRDIALNPDGSMWVATAGGLAHFTPADTADTCASAIPLLSSSDSGTELDAADDLDVFKFDVTEPLSRVEITIPDVDDRFDMLLMRSCNDHDIGAVRHIGSIRHIGAIRHIGSIRHIGGEQRLTFDAIAQTGTYYLVVGAKDERAGAFPAPYRVHLNVVPIDPAAFRTLILTDESRLVDLFDLDPDDREMVDWRTAIEALRSHDSVAGYRVDLAGLAESDPSVRQAYREWIITPTTATANALALSLQDWITRMRRTDLTHLHDIVLAGDDRVIPHLRVPIRPGAFDRQWRSESEYLQLGNLSGAATVYGALLADLTLTDDVYGARAPAVTLDSGAPLYVPELSVGRLVERPRDMTRAIRAYLDGDATLVITSTLVAGYDFMQDATVLADSHFEQAGVPDRRRDRLIGDDWGVRQLRELLFGRRHDLAFLAVHSTHRAHETPRRDGLRASEIVTATANLSGTIAYAAACHAGLNAPAIQATPNDVDFPEAWVGRGAAFVGPSGWAYGLQATLGYQETLMAELSRELVGTGGVGGRAIDQTTIGDALVAAKRSYFGSHVSNAYHAKTLAGTMLFGLPMRRVRLASESGTTTDFLGRADGAAVMRPEAGRAPVPAALQQAGEGTYRWPGVPFTFPGGDLQAHVVEGEGTYYTFSGRRPFAESGMPVQPQHIQTIGPVTRDGLAREPRGVVVTGASFHDLAGFDPVVERAGVLDALDLRPIAEPSVAGRGWLPAFPAAFQRQADDAASARLRDRSANIFITAGQYLPCRQIERLYDQVVVDIYFSSASDSAMPEITAISAHPPTAGFRAVTVAATDEGKVARVVALYGDDRTGWASVDLARDAGTGVWRGEVPANAPFVVQAVDDAGNVAIDHRAGRGHGKDACPAFLPVVSP